MVEDDDDKVVKKIHKISTEYARENDTPAKIY